MAKRTVKPLKEEKIADISSRLTEKEAELKTVKKINTGFIIKLLVVVLIGTAVFLLAQKNRGLILAGTVNNTPITRFALNSRLNDRYGSTAFDEMVTEELIKEQAAKNNIVVSPKEIQDEVATNEAQFGGKDQLMATAKQAGINNAAQLNDFFKLKLTIQKLEQKLFTASVKDADIQKYFDDNKSYFTGKKFEEVKETIKAQLEQQSIQQQFTDWFGKIRSAAKISSYL